jgi:hypothetical protein
MSTIAPELSTPARRQFVVPSLAIRVRAIFHIYAKTTVALVRVVCHRTLMKISECPTQWSKIGICGRVLSHEK